MTAIRDSVVAAVPSAVMRTHVPILVLRHGRSEWNAIRRWQGSFDSPLDHVGRAQARGVADELASLGRRWYGPVASTLARAAETAAIIGDKLGLAEPRLDHRLIEAHAGEWQGMTPDEIDAAYPGWLDEHRRPPGFEAYEQVVARATAALVEIARTDAIGPDEAALIVSHSGLIRSVVRSLGFNDQRIPNLGGVWLRVSVTGDPDIRVDGLFDPHGVAISGVDTPGEDPGEQSDETDEHRRAQR